MLLGKMMGKFHIDNFAKPGVDKTTEFKFLFFI